MTKKIDISLEKLLEVGAHFGHQSKRWNPKMSPYIYGEKGGIHIFDLVKTRKAILKALEALEEAIKEGQIILFVGTKKQVKDALGQMCKKVNFPYVNTRWLGGTLTNFDQVQKSIRKLSKLKQDLEEGAYNSLTKKERLLIAREVSRLEEKFGGISQLTKIPDMLVIIDTSKEACALKEAGKLGIKTIGVVDTNADPTLVTWPIPMNDDATKALDFIVGVFEDVIKRVKTKRKK